MSRRASLEAALASAEALAASLRAALEEPETPDELLDLGAVREHYGIGPDAIRAAVARGELAASRGARQRILVSRQGLEAWLRSRPVVARVKRRRAAEVIDLAGWDAAADRQLAAGGR